MIGGFGRDEAYSIVSTKDNGAAFTSLLENGSNDISVVKMDSCGSIEWSKIYDQGTFDQGGIIKETTNGDFLIGGYVTQNGIDFLMLKLDATGNIIFQKFNSTPYNESYFETEKSFNDKIYFFGASWAYNNATETLVVTETDTIGNVIWSKGYPVPFKALRTFSITKSIDNFFYIAGKEDQLFLDNNFMVYKIDTSGNLIWAKNYGDLGYERCWGISSTNNYGFILSGSKVTGSKEDILIIKCDSSGNYGGICTNNVPIVPFNTGLTSSGLQIFSSPFVYTNFQQSALETIQTLNKTYYCPTRPSANFIRYNICVGDCISFTNTSIFANKYLWRFQAGNISTSTAFNPPAVCYNVAGTYPVTLVSSDSIQGIADSVTYTINVYDKPFSQLPKDTSVCSTDSLLIGATPCNGCTYSWSNGTIGPNAWIKSSGINWVDVSIGNCTIRDSITVNITGLPAIGLDSTLCLGDTLLINSYLPNASHLWHDGDTSAIPKIH